MLKVIKLEDWIGLHSTPHRKSSIFDWKIGLRYVRQITNAFRIIAPRLYQTLPSLRWTLGP